MCLYSCRSSLEGESTANIENGHSAESETQQGSANGYDDGVLKEDGKPPRVPPVWLAESNPNEFTVCSLWELYQLHYYFWDNDAKWSLHATS